MRILSEKEICSLYTMKDAIQDLKAALIQHYKGRVMNPERIVLDFSKEKASILYMPSAMVSAQAAAVKAVSIFPNNPSAGKKTTQGVILLTDTKNGDHLALMNASYLTRLRTGAVSAIATDYLAKKNAETLAVIGCGAMAEEQVQGVLSVRDIQHIILYNRTKENADSFAKKVLKQNPLFSGSMVQVDSVEEAAGKADVIICATRSESPVFPGKVLQPGAHINGVGSYLPHMQEVDEETILRSSKIVVDTLEGAMKEAGDLIIPEKNGVWNFDRLHGEIDELAAEAIPGRESDTEITFFKSVGTAYFDLAVGAAVYQKAVESGIGTEVEL